MNRPGQSKRQIRPETALQRGLRPGFRLQLLRMAAIRRSEQGLVMGIALLAAVVLVLVAVAVASRTSSSWLSSVRQTEYRSAKEAAEYGFSRMVALLNTNQRCHLFVTKFANWTTVTAAQLEACNIDTVGAVTPGGGAAITTGTLPGFPEASYELVAYSPPNPLRNVAGSACSEASSPFGNLFGGSGRMRIIGRVTRNNQVSTYTLERSFHIAALPNPNGGSLSSSSLVNLGCWNDSIGPIKLLYDVDGTTTETLPDNTLEIVCEGDCDNPPKDPSASFNIDQNIQAPPFPGAALPVELNGVAAASYVDLPRVENYPYRSTNVPAAGSSTVAAADLRDECRLTKGGTEISCKILNVQNTPIYVDSRPELPPVNIFLSGRIGPSQLTGNVNANNVFINLGLCGNTSETSCGNYPGTTTPVPPRAYTNQQRSTLWYKVRLFGNPRPTPEADCTVCNRQSINVRGDKGINGMFIWLPDGTVRIGPGGGNYTIYGVIWACRVLSDSANMTVLGPINGTNVDFLENLLRDILSDGSGGDGNSFISVTKQRYRARGVN